MSEGSTPLTYLLIPPLKSMALLLTNTWGRCVKQPFGEHSKMLFTL